MPDPAVHVASIPTGGKPLTPAEWAKVERLLDDWKRDVLAAARKHPGKSYQLGFEQVEAFARLLDGVPGAALRQVAFGGHGPTSKAAAKWMRAYTMHELDDALNVYVGRIKDALLYGLTHQVNPTQVATWLYQATKDARVNWQLIARTEMIRANAVGRLHACKQMGFDKVWVPPHVGACKSCKRLLENKVFTVDELLNATNYGRPQGEWVACVPLHPRCRHGYLPYVTEVYDDAMAHYRGLEAAGLTDEDRLDELFDSSGQLKADAVLQDHERDAIAWKTADPWLEGLLVAISPLQRHNRALDRIGVAKVSEDGEHRLEQLRLDELQPALHQRAVDPEVVLKYRQRLLAGETAPAIEVHRWASGQQWIENGQHRAWAARLAGHETIPALVRVVEHPWESMEDVARELLGKVLDPSFQEPVTRIDVAKVPTSLDGVLRGPTVDLTLSPDLGPDDGEVNNHPLDPLLFDGARLRDDVALALETWWSATVGEDWQQWSWLFMPAHERAPVVVCDYNAARKARPEWRKFSDADLHFALVSLVAQHRGDRELAPGLPLDLRIVPIQTPEHDGGFLALLGDLAPGPLWYIDGPAGAQSRAMWVNGEPDVEPWELGKTFPAYRFSEASFTDVFKNEVAGEYSRADDARVLTLAHLTLDELADRLMTEDEFVAKAKSQKRIPKGDTRRGRIHPGEFTSDEPSASFAEHALGHLVDMRSSIWHEHGERVEKTAAILGEHLQLEDHKGGWRAGARAKITQQTRGLLDALGAIPEHHARALADNAGFELSLHDVPTAKALKKIEPDYAPRSADEILYGIILDGGFVVVGTSEAAHDTVLHEVGHALTMESLAYYEANDPDAYKPFAKSGKSTQIPGRVREHCEFYDADERPYEVAAEAYVDYCRYHAYGEGQWKTSWPAWYREAFERLLDQDANVGKVALSGGAFTETIAGKPAHVDRHMPHRPAPTMAEPDVGKMSPAPAANVGVEHWITVHPHGDEEKGQPVLVRGNSDGTMTVIGGAGGSMNYMRLDPKRRISKDQTKAADTQAGAKQAAGMGGPEQTLTEEERDRQEQEFKANQAKARATMEKADAAIGDLRQQLHALVADQIGAKWLTHGLIRHADGSTEEYELSFMERKQAMRKLIAGALQTLSVGRIENRDAEDAPYLFTERRGDFENMPDAEGAEGDSTASPDNDPAAAADEKAAREENAQPDPEAEARKINRRLPPLDEDQANSVMALEREIARWGRVKSKARKITQTGEAASSAFAMDWSDASIGDAVRERVQQEKRTIAARELLNVADRSTFRVTYQRAFHQGAVDAIDSFTHSVLGRSALSPETVRLLGPMGAAQMVARVIADRATAVGDPDKLSLDKVRGALGELKQRMESDVATRAANRARLAMDTAVAMSDERRTSLAGGETLWTATAAQSYRDEKYREAANTLGMAIAGLQAISSLEVALDHPPEKITVGGGETPSELLGLAQRARIKLKADQITKTGRGYSAELPAQALEHLFDFDKPLDFEHQERLKAIRTGKGLQRQIEANRSTPGMADQLGPAQAQGKMFLLATQPPNTARHWNLTGTPIEKKSEDLRAQMQLGDTLDFAPGVGKTHTGIAAAMQLMHDEPAMNHRVLVTCPATALAGWAGTVLKQGSKSAQIMGMETTHLGGGKVETRGKGGKHRQRQIEAPADFNIISHEQLARDPSIAEKLGATIVIADEAQKFKNERNQRSGALQELGDRIGVSRGDTLSRSAWASRFGGATGLEQGFDHITREDRVRQFREAQLDGHLFHMDAAAAGNDLPLRADGNANPFDGENDDRGYFHHEVKLDAEHRKDVADVVQWCNEEHQKLKAAGTGGLRFGGAEFIDKAVMNRPANALARTAAKVMAERLAGTVKWDGFKDHPNHADGAHAGEYAKKGVIFNEGVQEMRHLIPELEKQGVKVFSTVRRKDGDTWESVGHEDNEDVQKQYLAHKGPCVLVTTDRNSTARSWQFGDNNGTFQHGGTEFMHYSLPDKGGNATIAQREARIHRRGAQIPVAYHKLCLTELPTAKRQHDRLTKERKAQQMGGNSEQLVGGKETMRHRLDRAGVAPANVLQTRDEREAAAAATETGTNGDTEGESDDRKS